MGKVLTSTNTSEVMSMKPAEVPDPVDTVSPEPDPVDTVSSEPAGTPNSTELVTAQPCSDGN